MAIQLDDFKAAMRHFAAGVTIVTVKAGEEQHGLTVSAFVSVSGVPPLIAVVIDHKGVGHELLQREDAVFAVNMLKAGQEELSNRFAWQEDRFAMGTWETAVTGAPVLKESLVWLDCTIHSRVSMENNTMYIGEIQASSINEPDGQPLVYWNRGYRNLTDAK